MVDGRRRRRGCCARDALINWSLLVVLAAAIRLARRMLTYDTTLQGDNGSDDGPTNRKVDHY